MTTAWSALFDRAAAVGADGAAVRAAVEAVETGGADGEASPPRDPGPTRVVAAPAVLVADLFVDGPARASLDALRAHSWTTLVASDQLLDRAEAAVVRLADDADPALADDWRRTVEAWRERVSHPAGDDPTLASAYRGGAMHILSTDDRLTSPGGGATVRDRVETSVREPAAFAALFDPAGLYGHAVGGEYEGPDRDPRDRPLG